MKEQELKPCPFCGGKAELMHLAKTLWRIRCTGCDVEQPSLSFEEAVINRWNTRPENHQKSGHSTGELSDIKKQELMKLATEYVQGKFSESTNRALILSYAEMCVEFAKNIYRPEQPSELSDEEIIKKFDMLLDNIAYFINEDKCDKKVIKAIWVELNEYVDELRTHAPQLTEEKVVEILNRHLKPFRGHSAESTLDVPGGVIKDISKEILKGGE